MSRKKTVMTTKQAIAKEKLLVFLRHVWESGITTGGPLMYPDTLATDDDETTVRDLLQTAFDHRQFCVDMERAGESLIQLYRKYPEIKGPKKIDIVEDRLGQLAGKRKLTKIVMETSFRFPAVLALPRMLLRLGQPFYGMRHLLFPLYRWVAHYHYAVGMRRGLAR